MFLRSLTSEFIFAGLFPLKFCVVFAVQIAEDFVFVKCHIASGSLCDSNGKESACNEGDLG